MALDKVKRCLKTADKLHDIAQSKAIFIPVRSFHFSFYGGAGEWTQSGVTLVALVTEIRQAHQWGCSADLTTASASARLFVTSTAARQAVYNIRNTACCS